MCALQKLKHFIDNQQNDTVNESTRFTSFRKPIKRNIMGTRYIVHRAPPQYTAAHCSTFDLLQRLEKKSETPLAERRQTISI